MKNLGLRKILRLPIRIVRSLQSLILSRRFLGLLGSFARVILPSKLYLALRRRASLILARNKYFGSQDSPAQYQGPVFSLPEQFDLMIKDQIESNLSLVICCAFTGRYEVLEKSILESLGSKYSEQLRWFICGSSEEDKQFIEKMSQVTAKVKGLIWPNRPLGAKWDACMKMAAQFYQADLYAITGSDDILSSGLINAIIHKHNMKKDAGLQLPALYCTDNWTIVSTSAKYELTPGAVACRLNNLRNDYIPIGAGRVYSREFLTKVGYHVFDAELDRCLDDYGYLKIKEMAEKIEYYDEKDGVLISVKGDWTQLNTIEGILKADSILTIDNTICSYNNIANYVTEATFKYLFKSQPLLVKSVWASSDTLEVA